MRSLGLLVLALWLLSHLSLSGAAFFAGRRHCPTPPGVSREVGLQAGDGPRLRQLCTMDCEALPVPREPGIHH